MEILTSFPRIVECILRDLDPSLLQNIILGILAIFIPFAIVFLADVLNSEKQRNEFEKMVLGGEILNTKRVFLWSLLGIVVLAFFAGKDISTLKKIIALMFSMAILFLLSRPFWKILKFLDERQDDFEISFLKKLNFSKFLLYKNNSKSEKMIRAWSSFWTGETINRYEEIMEIFHNHIGGAITNKKYDTAVSLAQIYEKNFGRIHVYVLSGKILPKSLEWCEELWAIKLEHEKQHENYQGREKNLLSKFRLSGRKEKELFTKWVYFMDKFLAAIILNLLFDKEGHYFLFKFFKEYIEKKEAEEKFEYINILLRTFCKVFFGYIKGDLGGSIMWEQDFPNHWKLTAKNLKGPIPRFILHNFWRWARPRIVPDNSTKMDNVLSEVLTGIFPSVQGQLFSSFLILCRSMYLTDAIQKKVVFHISNSYQEEELQREETAEIILKYLGRHWTCLTCSEEDISDEHRRCWVQYSKEQKKKVINQVRKTKLQNLLAELNSKEIDDLCKKSKNYQIQRNNFKELIELLIEKVS